MAMHIRTPFRFRFPEILLVVLLAVSGTCLGFSSGGFVVNFSRVGFSIVSTVEKGVFTVTNTVKNTVGAVKKLSELKKRLR